MDCICMYIVSRKFTTSTSTTTPGPVGIESFADWAPAPMRDPANSRRPRESRDPKNANVIQPTRYRTANAMENG
jgi:hypothetical protein